MSSLSFCSFFRSSRVAVANQNLNQLDFLKAGNAKTYRKGQDNDRLKALIKTSTFVNDQLITQKDNIPILKDFFLGDGNNKKPVYSSQKGKTKTLLITTVEDYLKTALNADEDVGDDLTPMLNFAYELRKSMKTDLSRIKYAQETFGKNNIFANLLVRQWVAAPAREQIQKASTVSLKTIETTLSAYISGYAKEPIASKEKCELIAILEEMISASKESDAGKKSFLKNFARYLDALEGNSHFESVIDFIETCFMPDLKKDPALNANFMRDVGLKITAARNPASNFVPSPGEKRYSPLVFQPNLPLSNVATNLTYGGQHS